MIFSEAVAKYGIDSATKMFGLTDHAVIVVHPMRVELTCGRYHASEPTVFRHPEPQTIEQAIKTLKSPFQGMGITFEIISEIKPCKVCHEPEHAGQEWCPVCYVSYEYASNEKNRVRTY